jgi:hypothetical protein
LPAGEVTTALWREALALSRKVMAKG